MKVKDLIETLQQLPQGAEVYLSRDAEGNGYAALANFDLPYIRKDDVQYGRLDEMYWDEDLEEDGWTQEEIADLETVVVLWPM